MLRNSSVLRITFTGTPPLFQHPLARVPTIHFDPPRNEAWKHHRLGLTRTPDTHHRKAEWASCPQIGYAEAREGAAANESSPTNAARNNRMTSCKCSSKKGIT